MIRRLLAVTGVAASLLSATVVAAPAAVAAPGDPTQVALVVDYPDGSTRSFCVAHRSGMSGADVLAVASPTYGSGPYAGFVLKIGGQGTTPPTTSDYWAYWTTQNGGLVYSGSGVTSTRPAAGTVEAWHWNSSSGTESPSGGSYASLCPTGFASTPAPATPAPTSRGVAAPTGSGGGASTRGGGTAAGGSDATDDPTASTTGTSPGAATPGTSAVGSAAATPGAGSTTPGSTPASSRTSDSTDATTAAATGDDAGGPGLGTTAGLVLAAGGVVGLGAVAVVARRRRLDQD